MIVLLNKTMCLIILLASVCNCSRGIKHFPTINKGKFIFKEHKKFIRYNSNDSINVKFEFVNNTSQEQYIDTVKVKCHCTKIGYPHKIINIGEKGHIILKIGIQDKPYYFSQSAIVYFHGKKPIVLKVIGIRENK